MNRIECYVKTPGWWFVFHKDDLLVKTVGETVSIPFARSPEEFGVLPFWQMPVDQFGEQICYSALVEGIGDTSDGWRFRGMRGLFGQMEESLFGRACRAIQLIKWDHTHQFCSRCGSPAATRNEEGAQICRKCGYLSYPRISPAVIVAVLKEDKLLLAHNNRFPKNRYSVIAGYVEMGETLEDCIRREIREEAGIEVKNIRYFGSQSWPFTSSLMVAFTVEYAGGDISVDDAEISDARWFRADALPDIPDKISIARELIDWFVEHHRK